MVQTTSYQTLAVSDCNGVRTITLNRPERRNAISVELGEELCNCVRETCADPGVHIVVLTGAGRFFCAGGDVDGMASSGVREFTQDERDQFRARNDVVRMLQQAPQVTVAAVNGSAAGAGLALALACDFRLLADHAKLTTAFLRVGLSGDYGAAYFLVQLLGAAKARELMLLSPVLTAQQALAVGLATEVYAKDAFAEQVQSFVATLAALPRVAMQGAKRNLLASQTSDLPDYLRTESENHFRSKASEEHATAARAFVLRREMNAR